MHNVLIVDGEDSLSQEITDLKPNWQILHADDTKTALEMLHATKPTLSLILIRHRSFRPMSPDGIMLTRMLTLNENLKHACVVVMLDDAYDSRDNLAAFAAGAENTAFYPKTWEKHIT